MQAKSGKSRAFLYYFKHAPPAPTGMYREPDSPDFGAYHGAEILYALNNLGVYQWKWGSSDRNLADVLSSYWVNFARTGDPNGMGLPRWPAFGYSRQQAMHFGAKIGAGPVPHQAELDWFERYLARRQIN